MIDDKIEIAKPFNNEYFVTLLKNQEYLQMNKVQFPQKLA